MLGGEQGDDIKGGAGCCVGCFLGITEMLEEFGAKRKNCNKIQRQICMIL